MSDEPVNGKAVFNAETLELADDASAEIEIVDPRNKAQGTGIFITLLSKDAEKARAMTRGQLNRRFKTMSRAKGNVSLSAEELEAESMDLLVACTKDWRGMFRNGVEVPCTAENARDIYTKSPIIREQVDDAIADRTLFTKG